MLFTQGTRCSSREIGIPVATQEAILDTHCVLSVLRTQF